MVHDLLSDIRISVTIATASRPESDGFMDVTARWPDARFTGPLDNWLYAMTPSGRKAWNESVLDMIRGQVSTILMRAEDLAVIVRDKGPATTLEMIPQRDHYKRSTLLSIPAGARLDVLCRLLVDKKRKTAVIPRIPSPHLSWPAALPALMARRLEAVLSDCCKLEHSYFVFYKMGDTDVRSLSQVVFKSDFAKEAVEGVRQLVSGVAPASVVSNQRVRFPTLARVEPSGIRVYRFHDNLMLLARRDPRKDLDTDVDRPIEMWSLVMNDNYPRGGIWDGTSFDMDIVPAGS